MTGRGDPARDMEAARAIARQAAALGGRAYYVGGFVRDRLLGRENTDVDIEVHGLTPSQLEEICNKFFAAREGVSTEDRQRIMRFLENMCLGAAAVGYRTESLHGAGSPQAQRIMIARQGNIQGKKRLAKNIAGIQK